MSTPNKLFTGEISKNLKESTCENVIHELEVMIKDLVTAIKWTLITYWIGENDTCSEVQYLEQIMDIIGKTMLMIKLKMKLVTHKNTCI